MIRRLFFPQRRGTFTRIIGICNKLVIVRGYNIFALQRWLMKIPTHIFLKETSIIISLEESQVNM